MIEQVADAVSQDPPPTSPVGGSGKPGVRAQQKATLALLMDKYQAWKSPGVKKHRLLRSSANLGIAEMSVAELHSALCKTLRMDTVVASQRRSISSFDVPAYVPRRFIWRVGYDRPPANRPFCFS